MFERDIPWADIKFANLMLFIAKQDSMMSGNSEFNEA